MKLGGVASIVGALVLGLAMSAASSARAYGYGSPLTSPCHEDMTGSALRRARARWPGAAPLAATADDQLLFQSLVFDVPDDLRDIAAVGLLIGVRDHDTQGESGIDTQELARVHGEDDGQAQHCLRRSDEDGAEGNARGAAACREVIRSFVFEALDEGLADDGTVGADLRSELRVHLAFRGGTRVSLPTFYLRLGQALHTLQDAFSHTFRTPDQRRITVVLNWVEQVEGTLDEARDGPGHMRDLDLCGGLDAFRERRLATAREATDAIFEAVFDHGDDIEAKKRAVDAVLDTYMSYEPGCTLDNGWCDAPEVVYADGLCTCRLVGAGRRPGAAPIGPASGAGFALLVLATGVRRRRRARRRCAASGEVLR
ncbi:MAG: hypothetical protein AAGN82_05550 [Myxococcota bacterium]